MTVTPSTLAQISDDDLNTLHGAVAEGLITLKQESGAFGGKARILMLALAIQLDEEAILGLPCWPCYPCQGPGAKKTVASQTESPNSIVH